MAAAWGSRAMGERILPHVFQTQIAGIDSKLLMAGFTFETPIFHHDQKPLGAGDALCPMPDARCPIPNALFPMPYAQCPMPDTPEYLIFLRRLYLVYIDPRPS